MLKHCLSLSWGSTFAELQSESQWVRTTLLQNSIAQLIKTVQTTEQNSEIKKVFISMSVLRKILTTRLGNSVAQITTSGFEHWVHMRQASESTQFDLMPKRKDPLANPELIFSLNERVGAHGEILSPLQTTELDIIIDSLKQKQIERVCLNLLNSHANPAHQNVAKDYLEKNGFTVFSLRREKTSYEELSEWRRNLLDAALASFLERTKADLDDLNKNNEHTQSIEFLFLDTENGLRAYRPNNHSGLLFGRELCLQDDKLPVVYIGPEEWCFIFPENQSYWTSPWGRVRLKNPKHSFFQMQPGIEIELRAQNQTGAGQIYFGTDRGMDPGPALWGRSNKLTIFDFLDWPLEMSTIGSIVGNRRTEKTEKKVQDLFLSLKKNSFDWKDFDYKHAQDQIRDFIASCLEQEIRSHIGTEKFILTGCWAKPLAEALAKRKTKLNFKIQETKETYRLAASEFSARGEK